MADDGEAIGDPALGGASGGSESAAALTDDAAPSSAPAPAPPAPSAAAASAPDLPELSGRARVVFESQTLPPYTHNVPLASAGDVAVGDERILCGHPEPGAGDTTWEGFGILATVSSIGEKNVTLRGGRRVAFTLVAGTAEGSPEGDWRDAPWDATLTDDLRTRLERLRQDHQRWVDEDDKWQSEQATTLRGIDVNGAPLQLVQRLTESMAVSPFVRDRQAVVDAPGLAGIVDYLETLTKRQLRLVVIDGMAVFPFWTADFPPSRQPGGAYRRVIAIGEKLELTGDATWSGFGVLARIDDTKGNDAAARELRGIRRVSLTVQLVGGVPRAIEWADMVEVEPPDAMARVEKLRGEILAWAPDEGSWMKRQVDLVKNSPDPTIARALDRFAMMLSPGGTGNGDAVRAELTALTDLGERADLISAWLRRASAVPCLTGTSTIVGFWQEVTDPQMLWQIKGWTGYVVRTGHSVDLGDEGFWSGVGTLCRQARTSAQIVEIEGVARVRITCRNRGGQLFAEWERAPESIPDDIETRMESAIALFTTWCNVANTKWTDDQLTKVRWAVTNRTWSIAVNAMMAAIQRPAELPALLDIDDLGDRLDALAPLLTEDTEKRADSSDRALLARLGTMPLGTEVRSIVDREVEQLRRARPDSTERERIISYLTVISELPWGPDSVPPEVSLDDARAALDATHAGMAELKRQVIDQLASLLWWRRRRESDADAEAPMLRNILLVGPPGTGKTSILRSISTALGRRSEVISCGGISDVSGLNGFERSYVGARPGAIIDALRRAGTTNVVLGLDEIDKMDGDSKGDPYAVLMEITDPSQNTRFTDRYVQLPFDLSRVMVVATANEPHRIPIALRDRFKIVEIRGYSPAEKSAMARSHLLPRLEADLGFTVSDAPLDDAALDTLITEYTYESGVRSLIDALTTTYQRVILGILEGGEASDVGIDDIHRMMGPPIAGRERPPSSGPPGYGTVLLVETAIGTGRLGGQQVTFLDGTAGEVRVTGTVNDEIKETIAVAHSYVRLHASELGVDPRPLAEQTMHVHEDRIGVHKGGPSGGLAAVAGIVSALRAVAIPDGTAMTGEITLDGRVLPVGGIPEKLVAAHRAGIRRIIIPESNVTALEDVPDDVRRDLTVVPVSTIDEALAAVFGERGRDVAQEPDS